MVHWGTVFVTVTAASFLLGRRDLPKVGRFVGLYSGRSMGAILRAKKEFFDATKDNELVTLQREFQRGIEELNEIRSELTSVGSMRRPLQPIGTTPTAKTSGKLNHEPAAQPAGRSSVALASRAAYDAHKTGRCSAEASLAMAELKLVEQTKFAPRVENQEGGADYVSASIMDSLLLDKTQHQT